MENHQPIITEETKEFILSHRNEDIRQCAFLAHGRKDIDVSLALDQIQGYQIALKKLPFLTGIDNIVFPPHLNLEQCSSQQTAQFKQTILEEKGCSGKFADLTAGFGIDFMFISRLFSSRIYVEKNPHLALLAKRNFSLLGLEDAGIMNMECEEFLEKTTEHYDCMFMDPARRDSKGGKVVAIEDCEPDVTKLLDTLKEHTDRLFLKLSPMLDIHLALKSLPQATDVYVVSVDNECKELLILVDFSEDSPEVAFHAVNIRKDQNDILRFTLREEKDAEIRIADTMDCYLYEPSSSCLKAGAFRILCSRFGLAKLNVSTHLYTSDRLVDNFPGRVFKVVRTCGFGKKDIKDLVKDITHANITLRNFPSTEKEVRQRLKLKDGGDSYIFATTLGDSSKALILTHKV